MTLDLKFLEATPQGVLSGVIWPNPDEVADTYLLVQLITKDLLTTPGDDDFEPTYGGGLAIALIGIPGQEVAQAKAAVQSVLDKVLLDLAYTSTLTDPQEQLVDLNLVDLTFDATNTAWIVTVQVTTGASIVTLTLPPVTG
jgi:hypothetical protein